MLFARIESEGLAHYSYLIGSGGEAVVIDPRRDCDVYVDVAHREGYRIAHILETHRNEDYVVGSCELAARTEATIWHADAHLAYGYGHAVRDGQTWSLGDLELVALLTPGHTPGMMSYLLKDSGAPWAVFTGDALFAGEVGRVDLAGRDRMEEMAGLLYDSICGRLLPLGDGVLVCPAHGAGSVCGSEISDRPWTTIGTERRLNPRLQATSREEFVAAVSEERERPPYFRQMERLNVEGPPVLGPLPSPPPLSADEFEARMGSSQVLDTRDVMGFGASHVPGSLSIWQQGVARFAGWFLRYEPPILLVAAEEPPEAVARTLVRLGFDNVRGTLSGGMMAWHEAGKEAQAIGTITVPELCRSLDSGGQAWILDVRHERELRDEGTISGAHHIQLTQLPGRLDHVPRDERVVVFCGSGLRSMIAASLLRQADGGNAVVALGGMAAWNSTTCPAARASEEAR